MGRLRYYSYFFLLVILGNTFPVFSQVSSQLRNDQLKKILTHVYNGDASLAIPGIQALGEKDPAYSFLRALTIRWEGYPLDHRSKEFAEMMRLLDESYQQFPEFDELDSQEEKFIVVTSKALLAMYQLEIGEISYGEARKTYKLIREGDALNRQNQEFLLTSGIYNYLRDRFPERYALGWIVDYGASLFFRRGNKEKGLEQLTSAAEGTVLAQYEALLYLAHLNLRYEKNPGKSLIYSKKLIQRFPRNPFYQVLYAEACFWKKDFASLRAKLSKIRHPHNPFYTLCLFTFEGMLAEFDENDAERAKQKYQAALKLGEHVNSEEGYTFKTLALMGLARLHVGEEREDFEKRAKKRAPYVYLKEHPVWVGE